MDAALVSAAPAAARTAAEHLHREHQLLPPHRRVRAGQHELLLVGADGVAAAAGGGHLHGVGVEAGRGGAHTLAAGHCDVGRAPLVSDFFLRHLHAAGPCGQSCL